MNNYARFISVERVFELTTLDKNIDASVITRLIDEAQDIRIQEVLGYNLYNTIMGMLISGTILDPININYKNLLDNNIQRCLALWIKYDSYSELNYHLTNKAVATKSSDNSQPVSDSTLANLRAETKGKAEFYEKRIRETIINNPGLYPEYFYVTGVGRIQPNLKNYFNGIYLPGGSTVPPQATINREYLG